MGKIWFIRHFISYKLQQTLIGLFQLALLLIPEMNCLNTAHDLTVCLSRLALLPLFSPCVSSQAPYNNEIISFQSSRISMSTFHPTSARISGDTILNLSKPYTNTRHTNKPTWGKVELCHKYYIRLFRAIWLTVESTCILPNYPGRPRSILVVFSYSLSQAKASPHIYKSFPCFFYCHLKHCLHLHSDVPVTLSEC